MCLESCEWSGNGLTGRCDNETDKGLKEAHILKHPFDTPSLTDNYRYIQALWEDYTNIYTPAQAEMGTW